jgi:hypothetical protein
MTEAHMNLTEGTDWIRDLVYLAFPEGEASDFGILIWPILAV